MSLPYFLYYFPLLVGLTMVIIGVAAVLKPEAMSKKFGVATSGSGIPFVIGTGIRDLALGLVFLVLYAEQVWWMIVWTLLFTAIVAVSDFFVVFKFGQRQVAFVHLAGAIILVAFSVTVFQFL